MKTTFTLDNPLVCVAIISFWALLNFYPALNNDFSLDDTYYLEQVEHVKTWKDVWSVTQRQFSYVDYRPLPSLSFAVEKMLSGGAISPGTAHAVNLLIYILGAVMMYMFLLKLQNDKKGTYLALTAALLFISLPMHTSMVANIKSRDGLFSFLLGFIYLHGLLVIFTHSDNRIRLISAITAGLAITGATYSKLDGLNFLFATPLVVLLLNKKIQWKQILRLMIIGLISYRIFNILFQGWLFRRNEVITGNSTGTPMLEDPLFFTENPIVRHDDFPTKIAFGVQTVFEYILMVFKPIKHYFYYGFDMVKVVPLSDPVIWMKAAIIITLGLAAIWLFFKRGQLAAFGIGFFFISLVYCSNLFTPVAGIVADRYGFIASAGACIAVASLLLWIGNQIASRYKSSSSLVTESVPRPSKNATKSRQSSHSSLKWIQQPEKISLAITMIVCLIYLPFNISRSKDWKNYFTLFDADMPHITTKSYEANRIAIKNYVETAIDSDNAVIRQKYFAKALEYGQNAVAIYDSGMFVRDGMILALRGLDNFDGSLALAREVTARFDTSEVAWRVLTDYYYYKRYLDSAAYGYRKLIDIVPEDPYVYFFYVTALQESGKMQDGLIYCDSLIQEQPEWYLPHQAKSYLYLNVKDSTRAVVEIEKGFEKGWRDKQMLDVAGMYWWTRDQKKWEEMKKYLN